MGIGGSRAERIGERSQTELARLIRESLRDPRVGFVTLTGVEVSVAWVCGDESTL